MLSGTCGFREWLKMTRRPITWALFLHELTNFTVCYVQCSCDLAWIRGKGNGTPLQCSCLENPMDGAAWWAAVHGVSKNGHDWATSLSLFTFMHWRRKWQPTPVFLPEESQGRQSLVGCHLWGRTESDTTEVT